METSSTNSKKTLSCGILYVATGFTYFEEAVLSVKRSRPFLGCLKVAIVTDLVDLARSSLLFDIVIQHPNPVYSYRDKISGLLDLPFKYTLFLDCDAFLVHDLTGIFCQLGFYHVMCAHAPVRHSSVLPISSVSPYFPEFNSGVIFLRQSLIQHNLILHWLLNYDSMPDTWDQPSLRVTLWKLLPKGLQLGVLPPEANLRTTKPWVAGLGLSVCIVHGRIPDHEFGPFVKYLNSHIERFRTWNEWLDLYPDSQVRPKVAPQPLL